MVTITHVVIGGEFNDGVGLRYTKKYRIEYQRTESEGWQQFVNTDGTQVSRYGIELVSQCQLIDEFYVLLSTIN